MNQIPVTGRERKGVQGHGEEDRALEKLVRAAGARRGGAITSHDARALGAKVEAARRLQSRG
jgi:hypothetical protein